MKEEVALVIASHRFGMAGAAGVREEVSLRLLIASCVGGWAEVSSRAGGGGCERFFEESVFASIQGGWAREGERVNYNLILLGLLNYIVAETRKAYKSTHQPAGDRLRDPSTHARQTFNLLSNLRSFHRSFTPRAILCCAVRTNWDNFC